MRSKKTQRYLNGKSVILAHKEIIQSKKLLNSVYTDFYKIFKRVNFPKGPIVELGSGGGFIKDIWPEVLTSDIFKAPRIDKVISATKIPFRKNTIAGFIMLNVFHHINYPYKAISEMERCLRPKGKIVMIEPYNSPWGRFIYQNFHHETFDPNKVHVPNGALAWIIFKRDKKVFEKRLPQFKIRTFKPHTPIKYLLSGGLSKPALVPSCLYPLLKLVELFFSPINHLVGMFVTIEITKK